MTVEGESVEIMKTRVNLDYDPKGFYYATVEQGNRAALEQYIDQITPRERLPEPQRQQKELQHDKDFERE